MVPIPLRDQRVHPIEVLIAVALMGISPLALAGLVMTTIARPATHRAMVRGVHRGPRKKRIDELIHCPSGRSTVPSPTAHVRPHPAGASMNSSRRWSTSDRTQSVSDAAAWQASCPTVDQCSGSPSGLRLGPRRLPTDLTFVAATTGCPVRDRCSGGGIAPHDRGEDVMLTEVNRRLRARNLTGCDAHRGPHSDDPHWDHCRPLAGNLLHDGHQFQRDPQPAPRTTPSSSASMRLDQAIQSVDPSGYYNLRPSPGKAFTGSSRWTNATTAADPGQQPGCMPGS